MKGLFIKIPLIGTFLVWAMLSVACAAEPTPTPVPTAAPTGFANPDLLVDTEWLAQYLDDADIRIVDARAISEYQAGHIQGAISLPVENSFNPEGPKQMAGLQEQIEQLFGQKGISNDTRVIVYDNGKETKAPRILWTLEYYGHTNVSVLDGGFKKWQGENLPVANQEHTADATSFSASAQPSLLADKDDILAALNQPGVAIVDARSAAEYRGEDLRAKRGGHVPGAVNIDWRDLFTTGETPVFKSPAELRKMYEDAGVTKDKEVFVYCQTHQRSSVAYLALRLLGYDRVRGYDGSWQEWGNDPDVPIEQ